MVRPIALLVSLCALAAQPAQAQHPQAASGLHAADDASARVAGRWEGTYESSFKGAMELLVVRDTGLKATMQLVADHPFPALELREFKVAGEKLTWIADLMGTPCKSTAVISERTMKGEMVCDARTITFVLTKR